MTVYFETRASLADKMVLKTLADAGVQPQRTITGTANKITVTNGDGISANPTLTIPDAVTLVTPTITGLVTLSGGQIAFPATQNDSANANTLDDYEEGTFTPEFSATGCTFSYSAQTGVYTKIGRVVFFQITITLNTSGNTLAANPLSITGLPFTVAAATSYRFAAAWHASTNSYVQVIARINPSATTIAMNGDIAAATSNSVAINANGLLHATNGSTILVSGFYHV